MSCVSGPFKVTMPPTIEVLRGSCVNIPCSFDIEDTYTSDLGGTCKAMWKNEQQTVVFDSSNPQSSIGKLTGDLTKRDCTTTLNNMQPKHSNKFHLRVECDNRLKHNFIGQKLDISVKNDPLRPTLTPSTLKVEEGTSVSLKCSAPAPCLSHPPTLTWTPSLGHSQETLEENQDKTKVKTSVVTFTASHLHHRQEISCTAVYNKQDGSTESSVITSLTADISYSPKHTTVSVSPSGPVPVDSTVTLTCSSTANPAVRNYTWYRADGGQETFIGTGRVLNIKASEVSGPFFCKAENDLGAGRSNISQIDVQYSPKHTTVSVSPSGPVPEDSTVTLTCSSTANPAVRNYTWYRADGGQETFIGTGRVLNIKASEVSGPFFCKAENDLGAGRSNISQIDVQYSPKHTTVSVSPSGPVPEDSTVTLTCSSTANPAVRNYTWYRDDGDQKTFIGTGPVLNIKASEVSGPFFCKAENDLGAGRSNISQIDVQYSPKHTTVSVSPSGPVPEDSTVTLTCSSTANPAVRNYICYRADGGQETFIGTGPVLNIKASEVSGPFFCKAENDLGAGRSNISQIDVQYSPKHTTVSVSPSGPVPEDSNVTLTCSSTANPAVRNYTWYRADGGQETFIGTGPVLNIKASEVSGPFFCKAENDLGAGQSNISQIDVQYSPKHTTVSVSPSGPVPEDSNVTLTCSSTANPAVRNYTWYRADGGQETFIGTGPVLNIKASEVSGPFFCKAENDLGAGRSHISQIDVQFAPQILFSSDCTKTADQLNCSCETVGKPSPTLQWYLDGLPFNHSDKFAISNKPLNETSLRSIITVNQPQWRNLSTLFCRSSNSVGSATQRFYVYSVEPQTSAQSHDQVKMTVSIIIVVALLVVVCALLLVIRAQKTRHNLPKGTVVVSELLTSGEGNEVPNTTEDDIYVNASVLRQEDVAHPAAVSEPNNGDSPSSGPNNAEGADKNSEKKNEGGSDVVYASVDWKSKSKKKKKEEDAVDMDQPGSSYLEEERCMVGGMSRNYVSNAMEMGSLYDNVEPRNVKREVECEYAQVQFKKKSEKK
uniref:Ig-like domain-containing protein n=1 Tax=Dicentrarchus labrax TaxID=13489 RepID=A0A8C4F4M6_DICLA